MLQVADAAGHVEAAVERAGGVVCTRARQGSNGGPAVSQRVVALHRVCHRFVLYLATCSKHHHHVRLHYHQHIIIVVVVVVMSSSSSSSS